MKSVWDRKISAEVKEGPADCIRMDEVRAVLKKMKRHKAPGLSGLVAEMIQATGDIGTQWIVGLCNGIVKEGSIPEDWKSSVVLPIYKGKATLWSVYIMQITDIVNTKKSAGHIIFLHGKVHSTISATEILNTSKILNSQSKVSITQYTLDIAPLL